MNKRFNLTACALCALFLLIPGRSAATPDTFTGNRPFISYITSDINFGGQSVSQGKDSDATVKRRAKIGNFNKIDASQGIRIIFTQGENPGYADVRTTPSAKDYVQVYVKNGCLTARYSGKFKKINGPTIVKVASPQLCDVDLSSAASLTVQNNLVLKGKLELDLSSASKVSITKLQCTALEADMSSSASLSVGSMTGMGNIDMDASSASSATFGSVDVSSINIEASSAAKITMKKVSSERMVLDASSAANIKLESAQSHKVSADATSGSHISLRGSFVSVSKDASSGGSVTINGDSYSRSYGNGFSNSYNSDSREQARIAREQARLAREQAREQTKLAREQAREQTKLAREQSKIARKQAELARKQAEQARRQAEKARRQALREQKKIKNSSNNSDSSNGVYLRNPEA